MTQYDSVVGVLEWDRNLIVFIASVDVKLTLLISSFSNTVSFLLKCFWRGYFSCNCSDSDPNPDCALYWLLEAAASHC